MMLKTTMSRSKQCCILICTTIPLPIEIVVWVTPTIPSCMRIALWTMLEWLMSISDIVEKVNLILSCKERSTDRMDRSVSPTLIVESSSLVEIFKVVHVCLRTPEIEITNLKVGPDYGQHRSSDAPHSDTCCMSLPHRH